MKIRLVVLFSFFVWGGVFGQIGFLERKVLDNPSGSQPLNSYAFDMDNDGDMDVLSVSPTVVFWYENNDGEGEFLQQHIVIEGTGVSSLDQSYRSVYASDFDGDGDLDVVTASKNDNRIAWYENIDGLGNFSLKQDISENAGGADMVRVNDLDGDGDIDIVSYSGDFKIAWYENMDGLGNFSDEQIVIIETERVDYLNLEDIDGDNDIDIFYYKAESSASGGEKTLVWYENVNGLGTFSNQYVIATSVDDFAKVDLGDKDGDGDIDILYTYYDWSGDAGIRWYENIDGQGNFNPYELTSDPDLNIKHVKLHDMDDDGDSDCLFVSSNDTVWVMNNSNGQGDFNNKDFVGTKEDGYSDIEIEDINGDSNLDIIFSSWNDIRIGWYENLNMQNTFSQQQLISTYTYRPESGVAADIDNDGDIDLLSTFGSYYGIAWYENKDGEGSYGIQKIISIDIGGREIDVADLDGDGDMDVIGVDGAAILYWFENLDGLGSFSSEKQIAVVFDGANSVYLIDIDGDSDIDIVTGGGDEVIWFENMDGLGTFGPEQVIETNANNIRSVFASDFDGDGDMDILAGDQTGNKVSWYENLDGLGDFGPEQVITVLTESVYGVYSADLDLDGDMDVLSASWQDGKIAWYENTDGLGSFSSQKIISEENFGSREVIASDLDGDGDMDVVSTSGELVWFENIDGIGNYGVEQIIDIGLINSIFTEDIDNDGDVDVISTSRKNSVSWYENVNSLKNEINGYLRLDIDADGCDIDDPTGSNVMVITESNLDNLATFSTDNGFYQLSPDEGDFTTYVSTMLPYYYDATPISFVSNFTGIGNVETSDFCFVPNQEINDLDIFLLPSIQARPGFDAYYQLVFQNKGTTQLSGTVTLAFNASKVEFLTSTEIPVQSNNILTFDYEDLNPFETRTIDLIFKVLPPPTVNIGDVLKFIATINPISGDHTVDDNEFIINQTVIGSYDPNDITVLEGDKIHLNEIDQYLHYIIRFQNTGTADAINVRVENILDDKLDWNTIQLESYSHPNRVEIKDGNEMSFIFDEIYLPDSTTNEPASHGFIAYKIKPKSDIAIGDIISSTADIFFDFNEAVVTNTVMTEIVDPVSIDENTQLRFSIFPIPTSGILMVQSESTIAEIEIYDQLGQLVLIKSNANQIDLSNLNRGFYFCKVRDESGDFGIKKVVKE